MLPWIDLQREEFSMEEGDEEYWTPRAMQWGNEYLDALEDFDKVIRAVGNATPEPRWMKADTYRTLEEIGLREKLRQVTNDIDDLERRRGTLKIKATEAGSLKALLFEQGEALEEAVLKTMKLMGFSANRYRDAVSEFDAVLECPEGRCIGEVEGKDNKPINIDKFRQLMSNVHEDFGRKEVAEMAKPVLFGNAYRLTPPHELTTLRRNA